MLFYFRTHILAKELNSNIDLGRIPDKELLIFKVPVPVYHQIDKDFERVEGSFEYNNQFYEMVKQKLENDTIYTYCLRNDRKWELISQLSDHIQTHVLDNKSPKPSKPEKPLPTLFKEYLPQSQSKLPIVEELLSAVMAQKPYQTSFDSPFIRISTPPPKEV